MSTDTETAVDLGAKTLGAAQQAPAAKPKNPAKPKTKPRTEAAKRTNHAGGLGGAKGEAIAKVLKAHPDWAAKQVAEKAGCSVGRVYEVRRARRAASK